MRDLFNGELYEQINGEKMSDMMCNLILQQAALRECVASRVPHYDIGGKSDLNSQRDRERVRPSNDGRRVKTMYSKKSSYRRTY